MTIGKDMNVAVHKEDMPNANDEERIEAVALPHIVNDTGPGPPGVRATHAHDDPSYREADAPQSRHHLRRHCVRNRLK